MKKILENMRIFRLMFGFTQGEISEKLGISHTSYANIETGKAILDPNKLPIIAQALGVEEETLHNFDKNKYLKKHKIHE
jgi:transcriptional regulator with XRE-family HTH domain